MVSLDRTALFNFTRRWVNYLRIGKWFWSILRWARSALDNCIVSMMRVMSKTCKRVCIGHVKDWESVYDILNAICFGKVIISWFEYTRNSYACAEVILQRLVLALDMFLNELITKDHAEVWQEACYQHWVLKSVSPWYRSGILPNMWLSYTNVYKRQFNSYWYQTRILLIFALLLKTTWNIIKSPILNPPYLKKKFFDFI